MPTQRERALDAVGALVWDLPGRDTHPPDRTARVVLGNYRESEPVVAYVTVGQLVDAILNRPGGEPCKDD